MQQSSRWKRNAFLGLVLSAAAIAGIAYVLFSGGDDARLGKSARDRSGTGDSSAAGAAVGPGRGRERLEVGGERAGNSGRLESELPPLLSGVVSGREASGDETPIAGASVRLLRASFVEGVLRSSFETAGSGSGGPMADRKRAGRLRERIEALRRSAPTAKTDSSGVFEFRGIEPRPYLVLTVADGWIFRYGDVVVLEAGDSRELNQTLDRGASISGRVIDARGGGVAGILVQARARTSGAAAVTMASAGLIDFLNGTALRGPFVSSTASDGTFTIASLPPGVYDLEARGPSGLRVELRDVASGRSDVLLFLGEPASVEGVIVDLDGTPLEGFALELEVESEPVNPLLMGLGAIVDAVDRALGEGPRRVTTDARGRFRIEPLGPDRYVLSFAEKGVRQRKRRFVLDWGENLSLGVVEVDPGARVRGRVLSESGEAIQGARITVMPSEVGFSQKHAAIEDLISGRSQVESGPDGGFEVGGLAAGQYRVSVNAAGWAPSGLSVETGDEPCEIRLVPGTRVTGHVTDARTGAPVRARVRAGQVETTAGEDGRFILDGVVFIHPLDPAAAAPLQRILGFARPALSAHSLNEEIRQIVTLTVTADGYATAEYQLDLGQGENEAQVGLHPAPEITGRVLSPQGDPVRGSLVRVIWNETFPPNLIDPGLLTLRTAVSDAEGRYSLREFREIAPRQWYQLLADHPDYARGASESFSLDGRQTVEIDLVLRPPAVVMGIVSDGAGPVAGAEVRLAEIDKAERDATSDVMMRMLGLPRGGRVAYTGSDGRFVYRRVGPGDYVINAEVPGLGSADERELRVEAGDDVELEVLVDPGEEIAGSVLDTRGNSLEGATVELRREPEVDGGRGPDQKTMRKLQRLLGGAFKRARTDEEGVFTIRGIPKGRYTVRALMSGYATAEVARVAAGDTDVELVLAAGATLTGRVVDAATGMPIPDFSLFVLRAGEEEAAYVRHFTGGRSGPEESHPEGRFERNDLEAGEYHVSAKAEGYLPASVSARLVAGGLVEQDFALVRAASIRGVVIDASTRRPLTGAYVRLMKGSLRRAEGAPDGRATSSNGRQGDARDGPERFLRGIWPSENVRTDETGRFLLESAAAVEPVTVAAEHNEYLPETRELPGIRAGEERELVIPLARGLTLEGRAVTESGDAVASKFMFLNGDSPETGGVRKSAVTSGDGAFRFTGLRPGRYRVVLPEATSRQSGVIELRESVYDYVLRVERPF